MRDSRRSAAPPSPCPRDRRALACRRHARAMPPPPRDGFTLPQRRLQRCAGRYARRRDAILRRHRRPYGQMLSMPPPPACLSAAAIYAWRLPPPRRYAPMPCAASPIEYATPRCARRFRLSPFQQPMLMPRRQRCRRHAARRDALRHDAQSPSTPPLFYVELPRRRR